VDTAPLDALGLVPGRRLLPGARPAEQAGAALPCGAVLSAGAREARVEGRTVIGPLGQAGYRRQSILVASPAAITPTLSGVELVTNGTMEAGDPPSSWTPYNVIAAADADRHLGAAAAKLTATGGNPSFYQFISTTAGLWYQAQMWAKVTAGDNVKLTANDNGGGYTMRLVLVNDPAAYTAMAGVFLAGNASTTINAAPNVDTDVAWIDDVSCQAIILPSTQGVIHTLPVTNFTAEVAVTLTAGTQVGLRLCLDDPANPLNFVDAYHDGTNAHLVACIAGVYQAEAINAAATYGAGYVLKVIKYGSIWQLWYNGTQIGTNATISAAGIISNTQHTWLSTYAGNTFSNFKVLPF
jgi:hypothetical protein